LLGLPLDPGKPTAIICHTVKGKGAKFIENDMEWHHKNRVSDEELQSLYTALGAN
jgi:transketolase